MHRHRTPGQAQIEALRHQHTVLQDVVFHHRRTITGLRADNDRLRRLWTHFRERYERRERDLREVVGDAIDGYLTPYDEAD